MNEKVLGVVVTYYPDSENILNIIHSSKQVQKLVVVDNTGSNDIKNKIEKVITNQKKITLICNEDNLGIGKASEIGALAGEYKKFDWVLILDQDSKMDPNMVKNMINFYNQKLQKQPVGALSPLIKNYGILEKQPRQAYFIEDTIITSGMLVPSKVMQKFGFLDSRYIIDGIDEEYSLRLRSNNLKLFKISKAILNHKMGNNQKIYIGTKELSISNSSPIRYYYRVRDTLQNTRKYLFKFPKFILFILYRDHFKNFVKILFFEPNKIIKLKMITKAYWHFIINKTGKYEH